MRKLLVLLAVLLLALPLAAHADILGVAVPEGATTIDLTKVKSMDSKVNALVQDLAEYPNITTVDLTGVNLSTKNKGVLVDKCPGVTFLWKVKVGDVTYSSTDTVMDLDTPKGRLKLSAIREALRALPNIKTVLMYKYGKAQDGPTFQGMVDYLLDEFPEVDFGWTMNWFICSGRRVYLRSDATAFSTLKGRQDPRYTADQIWERLKYFPDLLAIDVGHNNVSDLTFLKNFPKLRRLIVIDSKKPVTDISPLADLMDLEYIELFMQDITDISALANHTKLLDLNLCHNNVTDLSPLYSCVNLKRLWISYNPGLTEAEVEEFKRHVPGCKVETVEYQSTGAGWRSIDRYDILVKSFEENVYYPFKETIE